jgi:hypothetical protein
MNIARNILFTILLFFTVHFCIGQNSFYVVTIITEDSVSKLPISKVALEFKELVKKSMADKNGQLKFAIPTGRPITIEASHPDYFSKVSMFSFKSDSTIIIKLDPIIQSVLLGEVETSVYNSKKLERLTLEMESLNKVQIESIPSLGGEKDLVKSLTTLPGFNSGTEGTTELTVRGGTTGENLYLLDGYTLYKSSHLLGLLSVYNNQIISGFDAYKSGYPAKFGGRISSVIDVKTIEPNLQKIRVNTEIGLMSSKVTLQIPLIKGRSSFLLGGRVSYIDKLVKLFQPKNQFQTFNYYDLYGKWLLKIGNNNTLNIDFYSDRDEYDEYIKDPTSIYNNLKQWRNMYIGFRLNTQFNEKSDNILQAGFCKYENLFYNQADYRKSDGRFEKYSFKSTLNDFFIRNIATLKFTEKISLEFGGEWVFHHLMPSDIEEISADTSIIYMNSQHQRVNELNFFSDLFYSFNDKLNIKIGARLSNYLGVKSYFEPRMLIKFMPDKTHAFSLSYTRVSQPMHLLTNPGLGFSTDIWLTSNEKMKPSVGNQFGVNWVRDFQFLKNKLNFSAEAFYKTTNGVLEYRDGFCSNYFTSPHSMQNDTLTPFNIVTSGQNDSYGIEFLLEKKEGKLTGWVSYTLAKSVSLFAELNKGKEFPSRYDRRHNFSINATYAFNKTYQLSANWNYGSGLPLVIAQYVYFTGFFNMETGSSSISSFPVPVNTDRNNYRMKATHTLNISASKKIKLFKMDGKLELGVYNVYYHKNPTYYTYDYKYLTKKSDQSNSSNYNPVVKMVSVLPILPYFNISIHF